MNDLSPKKQPNGIWPGAAVVIGLILLFGGQQIWKWANSPRDLQRLAKKFSSIYAYMEPPVVNHAGTAIGMIRNTPNGPGIFIADLVDKKERMICVTNDAADIGQPHVYGWSPDDATFVYRWNVALHFVNAAGTPIQGEISTPYMVGFTWLSVNSCVYIDSGTNDENGVQVAVARKIDTGWRETTNWPLTTIKGKPKALLAVDTNTVAWIADSAIWQMNVSSGKIQKLYSNTNGDITSLAYSGDTGTYLFVQATRRSRTSTLFTLFNGTRTQESDGKSMIEDAKWIDHGKSCIYRVNDGDNSFLLSRELAKNKEAKFFPRFQIYDSSCHDNDSRVYVFASRTNEAPSLWQCDVATGNTSRLLTPWGFKDAPVCFQPALDGYAPMPNKHFNHFVLIPPADFSRQKKYPLVIGMQGYDWMNVAHATYSQALANCGAYVALTGYHYTRQSTDALLDYTNNVMAVYNQMAKNPNVDTSRVYIFAFSSSTIVVNCLIEAHPSLWRGAMLFNPTAPLPTPNAKHFPKLLVTAGSDEEWLWKQFPAYKGKMAQAGIAVETHVHADTGHIERSQNTLNERAMLMGKFVFE